jgi:hypothetical protein
MFKNYFKIAFRNLFRNKAFSFINIAGLAVGMASAMLILLWIQNEMSHDRFHEKIDRLYTMNNRDKFNGALWAWSTTPKILGPTLKQDYPEVEEFTRRNETGILIHHRRQALKCEWQFCRSWFFKHVQFSFN